MKEFTIIATLLPSWTIYRSSI